MRARRIGSIVFTCMLLGVGLPLAMYQSVHFEQTSFNATHLHTDSCFESAENCNRAQSFWLTRLIDAIIPARECSSVVVAAASDFHGPSQLAYYNWAILRNPTSRALYNNRALALCNLGQYEKALADHDMALKLGPGLAYLYSNRGYTRSHVGDFKRGLADCNMAIDLDPFSSYAHNNRGYARYNLGDKEGAIADFKKAIELDVTNPHAFLNLDDARNDRKLRKWRD